LLKENNKYIPEKKGSIELYFGNFIFGDEDELLFAELGRSMDFKIPKYEDGIFHDEVDEIYPHVHFLWNRSEQLILIEIKTSVFRSCESVIKSIEYHFNNLLEPYGYAVFIEPLTEKTDFWKAVHEYEFMYEVNFELHMPNFLGKTQKDIKEVLNIFKEDNNATGISYKVSNRDGRLILPEDDPRINSNLEWITKGGGSWYIKGKKPGSAQKATIKSTKSQYIKTMETSIEFENYTAEEIISIFKDLNLDFAIAGVQVNDDSDE